MSLKGYGSASPFSESSLALEFFQQTRVPYTTPVPDWDRLYAMLTLLLNGMASDYVLEGPSRARTATIVTIRPDALIERLGSELGRGASYWEVRGAYKREPRTLVQCTIYRPQMTDLKRIVQQVDPDAFVSIGVTQQVLGEGFSFVRRT